MISKEFFYGRNNREKLEGHHILSPTFCRSLFWPWSCVAEDESDGGTIPTPRHTPPLQYTRHATTGEHITKPFTKVPYCLLRLGHIFFICLFFWIPLYHEHKFSHTINLFWDIWEMLLFFGITWLTDNWGNHFGVEGICFLSIVLFASQVHQPFPEGNGMFIFLYPTTTIFIIEMTSIYFGSTSFGNSSCSVLQLSTDTK